MTEAPRAPRFPWAGAIGGLVAAIFLLGIALLANGRPPPQENQARMGGPLPPPGAPGHLTEIAAAVGLDFVHQNGASAAMHVEEVKTGGGAFLDHDGDGDLDVFLVNGPGPTSSDRLYRNDAGRYTDVTAAAGIPPRGASFGFGCAVADYDNDGDADLAVSGSDGVRLLRNQGDGTFREVAAAAGLARPDARFASGLAFLDYDRDGHLDLYVCRYLDVAFRPSAPCLVLGYPDYCGPASYPGLQDWLFRNRGDGTFEDTTAAAGILGHVGKGLGVACGDLDGDGWTDIYVANDTTQNLFFHNRGDGRFEEVGLESGAVLSESGEAEAGMGVDLGDYDGDGDLDIVVTNFQDEANALYRNEGAGTGALLYSHVSLAAGVDVPTRSHLAFGCGLVDLDNDGWLDLFFANGHVYRNPDLFRASGWAPECGRAQRNQFLRNRGDGTFEEASDRAGPGLLAQHVSRAAVFGDYDGDGDLDVLVTSNGGPVELLRNEGSPRNRGLRVRLEGTRSNRDGLGTIVRARLPGGRVLTREHQTAHGFAGSSSPFLHLGLADASGVETLDVAWPSGLRERHEVAPGARTVLLREGDGLPLEGPAGPHHAPTPGEARR